MTFEQALTALKAGKKIRLSTWPNNYFIEASCLSDGSRQLSNAILADDWEILEEPKPQPEPTIEELRRAIVAIVDCIPATAKVHAAARVLRRQGDE